MIAMSTLARWLSAIFVLLLAISVGGYSTYAQSGDRDAGRQRYFPQTGHTISGDFLIAYESVPNPELVYGYPITSAFHDATIDRMVQYFERARFELHTENPPELRVVLTPLGKYLYTPALELKFASNSGRCRSYQDEGVDAQYKVCYAFLDFFEQNGGVEQFGYPVSNFELHGKRIVQYFQRARLEYHPELQSGQRVVLAKIGEEYFHVIGEETERILYKDKPIGSNAPQPILDLRVRAYPLHSVLPNSDEQTIYIVVQDQKLLPIPDADVTLEISLPSGQTLRTIVTEPTDKNGITKFKFSYENQPPGLTVVTARVNVNRLQAETVTSFRIWR
jgi:hypothetical protein